MLKKKGRLIDLPLHTTPPILFNYQKTATLDGSGNYDFTTVTAPAVFTPNRPILPNALYLFSEIKFAADIADLDYAGAVTTAMAFYLNMKSAPLAPVLREPIPLPNFFQLPYALHFLGTQLMDAPIPGATTGSYLPSQGQNNLLGNVSGVLLQTPALLGKQSVTVSLLLSAQEVIDTEYIQAFKHSISSSLGMQEAPGVR